MLKYTNLQESSSSSFFIITTPQVNTLILAFNQLDKEEMHFDSDFLQDNVVEMVIAKASTIPENYCKELALTIKDIFDSKLKKQDKTIIYICVTEKSLKHQLMLRFINNNDNDHFNYLSFNVEDKVFCFFFNEKIISTVKTWSSLVNFFKEEYGINFGTKDN
jgi:hypothetical protein